MKTFQQLSRLPGSYFQQLTNASIYLIVLALAAVSLISLLEIIRKRKVAESSNNIFGWLRLFAILLTIFLPYGEEGLFRAFIFALPFFVLLSVFLLKDKPRLLSIFIIFTLIVGIAALYGPGSYRVATETELQGTSYCALKIPDKNVPYLPTNNELLYQFEIISYIIILSLFNLKSLVIRRLLL